MNPCAAAQARAASRATPTQGAALVLAGGGRGASQDALQQAETRQTGGDEEQAAVDDLVTIDDGAATATNTVCSPTHPPTPLPPLHRTPAPLSLCILSCFELVSQAILAASAAGGRKAVAGDPEWSTAGSWPYMCEVLPTISAVQEMPEVKQALSLLEGGGGGFSNAGVPLA